MPNWGQPVSTNAVNTAAIGDVFRMMGGTSPAEADMTLDSVSVYLSGGEFGSVRVAVYQGGTLADPTGATLVEDLGALAIPAGPAFRTVLSAANPALAASTPTWIAIKTPTGSGISAYWSTSSADAGDFQTATGRDNVTGATGGTDPTVAYPNPLDGADSFSAAWYPFYLTYSTAAASGPTIDTQPVADTVLINGDAARSSASFTVAATGTGTLTYQWELETSVGGGVYANVADGDGATWAGATTTNLTATFTVKTLTGRRVRCVVTDDNGSTTSSAVALTVYTGPVLSKSSGTTNASGVDTLTCTSDYPNADGEFTVVTATAGGVTKQVALHYETPA